MNKTKLSIILGFLVGAFSIYLLGTNEAARNVDSFLVQWADSSATTRPQHKNHFAATVVDSLTYLTGTNKDTTCAFDIYPYMSLFVALDDTSSDDSTSVRFDLYVSVSNQYRRSRLPIYGEYRRAKMMTASGDTVFNITESAIPVGQSGYIIANGLAGNKTESAVTVKLTLSGI